MNKVEIILPERKVPKMRIITKLWIGFGMALIFAAFINLSESLGALGFGMFVFLYIYDEDFRRLFNYGA